MTAIETTTLDLYEFEADFETDDEIVHITTCYSVDLSLCGVDLTYAEWAQTLLNHTVCKECLDRINKRCGARCRGKH